MPCWRGSSSCRWCSFLVAAISVWRGSYSWRSCSFLVAAISLWRGSPLLVVAAMFFWRGPCSSPAWPACGLSHIGTPPPVVICPGAGVLRLVAFQFQQIIWIVRIIRFLLPIIRYLQLICLLLFLLFCLLLFTLFCNLRFFLLCLLLFILFCLLLFLLFCLCRDICIYTDGTVLGLSQRVTFACVWESPQMGYHLP